MIAPLPALIVKKSVRIAVALDVPAAPATSLAETLADFATRLRYEDQVFVSEFVRNYGSIKDMEKAFGISYPTVKNRLNRIIDQLQLVEVGLGPRLCENEI